MTLRMLMATELKKKSRCLLLLLLLPTLHTIPIEIWSHAIRYFLLLFQRVLLPHSFHKFSRTPPPPSLRKKSCLPPRVGVRTECGEAIIGCLQQARTQITSFFFFLSVTINGLPAGGRREFFFSSLFVTQENAYLCYA